MKDKSTAWLIDSSIYVFKAWYTHPEVMDINGNSINAVRGFLDFVYKLLNNEKPQRIAFAFDESLETSHRRDIYPDYKANRASAPKSLRHQFQLCRLFLSAFGIHQNASKQFEADDLIGTWTHFYNSLDIPVNIITADKDLAQLIGEKDHWWEYLRGEKLDDLKITKRFGAAPPQIADQLAIAGDKSDNIPGVPGIGMSTAGKLLRRFGSLDQLFMQLNDISSMQIRGAKRIQDLIIEHQETIRLSRQLTIILNDIEKPKDAWFSINPYKEESFLQLCIELRLSENEQNKWRQLHASLLNQSPLIL